MAGASFFRSGEGKCPKCGAFGEQAEEEEIEVAEGMVCPVCKTVFNEYVILDEGKDKKFRNN